MTNLSEKLEQLSAAATQGELTAIGYGYEKYTAINEDGHEAFSTARKANAAFITELWNLYRTGLLVVAQADDATVERVARALQDMPYMADWDDLEDEDQEHMREMARIAIRALKSPKPPIL